MTKYPVGNNPNNIIAAKFEVEFENVFHFKNLYKLIHEWLEKNDYSSIDGGQHEQLYMELVNGAGNMNHHIWWRLEKKESQYHKFFLKINYQTLNLSKTEIMHNGKKLKTNKGDIILRVEGWLMIDYNDQWKKDGFLKHFEYWFNKRWYKSQVESFKKKLWFEVYDLQDVIKDYLKLNSGAKMPEPFFPHLGHSK